MRSSTTDNAEGKVEETAWKAVGNRDLEAKGKIENLDWEIREKLGQIKKVIGLGRVISLHPKKIENLDWKIQEKLGQIKKVMGLR